MPIPLSKHTQQRPLHKESDSPTIKIEELEILENRLLLFKLSYPKQLKKYFSSDSFWAKYDVDLQDVDESILQIPAVSNMLPVAWATGADIFVKKLDATYLQSVEKIKSVMKMWYRLPFSTRLFADEVTFNKFSNKRCGLLFSGGIDSTASYIRHRDAKPNLIMIWGADIPLSEKALWEKTKKVYQGFAQQERAEFNFIETNLRHFINERLLSAKFGRHLSGSWWGYLHHGIGLLGLTAPLTVVERMGTVFIASSISRAQTRKVHWGSHPFTDNLMSWADIKVIHDIDDLNRHEKIKYILKNYIEKASYYPSLRVCWSQFKNFNCGKCEKCTRTITALVLENIDPNKCGFDISDNYFDILKRNLIENKINLEHPLPLLWQDIQRNIPEKINHNLHNCQDFFKWFKGFTIKQNAHRIRFNLEDFLLQIYYELPQKLQNTISLLRVQRRPIVRLVGHALSLISEK